MSPTLPEWLTAQFDFDEQHALKDLHIAESAGDWKVSHGVNMPSLIEQDDQTIGRLLTDEAFQHAGRFKPQRMRTLAQFRLDEIAAKREVLRHHSPKPATAHPGFDCLWCKMPYPCFDVMVLAQPYRGRDGFRGEWTLP